jgi:mono/diheme cytochrome c family protein
MQLPPAKKLKKFMWKFLFLLSFIITIASCNKTGQSQFDTNHTPDGSKLYKSYCLTCHGIHGDMGANGAFNLTTSKISLEEKIKVIREGRNNMIAFKDILSYEQIKAVAEYTLQLKK